MTSALPLAAAAGARIKHFVVCVRVQFVISPARDFAKGKMRRKKAAAIVRAASRLENIFSSALMANSHAMQTPPSAFVCARSAFNPSAPVRRIHNNYAAPRDVTLCWSAFYFAGERDAAPPAWR